MNNNPLLRRTLGLVKETQTTISNRQRIRNIPAVLGPGRFWHRGSVPAKCIINELLPIIRIASRPTVSLTSCSQILSVTSCPSTEKTFRPATSFEL